MGKSKIKVAIVGVGNCFAGLYEGLEYYKTHKVGDEAGLMHPVLGGYELTDIEFVCAFDVDEKKVGKNLLDATYTYPNEVRWIPKEKMPKTEIVVRESPVADGLGIYILERVTPVKNKPMDELVKEIKDEIKRSGARIILSYLPVGSVEATRFWAQMALDTKCAFVNCIPEFIASDEKWAQKFKEAGLPVLGDDIKAQVGSTIVHRTLARLVDERGGIIDTTYQINVGGNSVTGDQEILLMLNGETIRTRIGDFVDKMAGVYGQKREDGKEVVDLSSTGMKLECFTIDENFNTIVAPVSALIKHGIGEELYEVETSEGRKIKITKDHNVFALNGDGKLEEKKICELKEKESMIAVPRSLQVEEKRDLESVSLMPYLKELFAQGIDADGNIVVHNHPEMKIPSNLKISDELLAVCGMWLADGSFDRIGSANIEIACGEDEECMEIIEEFTSAYNINYNVRGQAQVSVRIMSKTMAKIFRLALGLGGNSYTKRMPSWAFNLSERQISIVLKGYVSGDGCVSGKQIRWTTASEGLAHDLQTLFMQIGIRTSIFREDYSKKNEKKSFKTNLPYITHGIISSREDVGKFVEKVGFLQVYKNQSAMLALSKLAKGGMDIIPKFSLLKKWGICSRGWAGFPTLRSHIVLSQLDKVKEEADKEKIKNICTNDTLFLKIKSVRKIPAEPQYVYDLCVPGYQRFVCSNILVHNTDFLNMKEQSRLVSKRISKTESVQSQLKKRLADDKIYVGPSDFIPFLSNTKLGFMRIAGKMWADVPFNMEIRLEVDDKANSGGITVDAIRCAQIALDRGLSGYIEGPSAYFMKHPPKQYPDPVARQMTEDFISDKK